MKVQRTNSTFATSDTQADASACKRATSAQHTGGVQTLRIKIKDYYAIQYFYC